MKRLALIAAFAFSLSGTVYAQEHAQPAEGKAHAEEDEGNLEIWKWANFAILAIALGWLAGKNAPAFFRSRTEEIQRGIAEASKQKQEAEARAAKMEARMASLQSEIEHVRADAKTEFAKEAERIRKETEQYLSRVQAQGEQEIEATTKHAEQELRAQAAQLALEIAEQRIRARMSNQVQDVLVGRFLQQLGNAQTSQGVRQ